MAIANAMRILACSTVSRLILATDITLATSSGKTKSLGTPRRSRLPVRPDGVVPKHDADVRLSVARTAFLVEVLPCVIVHRTQARPHRSRSLQHPAPKLLVPAQLIPTTPRLCVYDVDVHMARIACRRLLLGCHFVRRCALVCIHIIHLHLLDPHPVPQQTAHKRKDYPAAGNEDPWKVPQKIVRNRQDPAVP
jgi:hypothetical protein